MASHIIKAMSKKTVQIEKSRVPHSIPSRPPIFISKYTPKNAPKLGIDEFGTLRCNRGLNVLGGEGIFQGMSWDLGTWGRDNERL